MSDKWSRCSLRISSAERTCGSISELLQTKPSFSADRGDPVSRIVKDSAARDLSTWILESGVGSTHPLEEHLSSLVDFIDAHADALRDLSDDCALEIVCGFASGSGQGGFVVGHDVMQKLAAVGIDIVMHLYPPERGE